MGEAEPRISTTTNPITATEHRQQQKQKEPPIAVSGLSFTNINMFDRREYNFEFENGLQISINGMPPAPVVWVYNTVDILCGPLGCQNWRDLFHFNDDPTSWLSDTYRVPDPKKAGILPDLLTFSDFQKQQQSLRSNNNNNLAGSASSAQQLLSSAYQFAFETPSTVLADLTTPTAVTVMLFLVLLLRRVKAVLLPWFSSVGRRAALNTHGEDWVEDPANQIRITKFGEYVFRLVYHSAISVYGLVYFCDKPWWQPGNTDVILKGFPYHDIEPGMTWYYLLQAAYNVDAFVSLLELSFVVGIRSPRRAATKAIAAASSPWQSPIAIEWSPTVRGDFQEMFVHHIVTNVMVISSTYYRFTRAGSMVFLIHDLSDVPVDLSKLANFVKWQRTTVACFTCMTLVWLYTRLIIFPFTIYKTLVNQSHYVLQEGAVPAICYVCYRHFFYIFLGLLILLHLFWFIMFLRMYYALLVTKKCHDLSEHKNGELSPGKKKKGE